MELGFDSQPQSIYFRNTMFFVLITPEVTLWEDVSQELSPIQDVGGLIIMTAPQTKA